MSLSEDLGASEPESADLPGWQIISMAPQCEAELKIVLKKLKKIPRQGVAKITRVI